jgi:hypothetical protein
MTLHTTHRKWKEEDEAAVQKLEKQRQKIDSQWEVFERKSMKQAEREARAAWKLQAQEDKLKQRKEKELEKQQQRDALKEAKEQNKRKGEHTKGDIGKKRILLKADGEGRKLVQVRLTPANILKPREGLWLKLQTLGWETEVRAHKHAFSAASFYVALAPT